VQVAVIAMQVSPHALPTSQTLQHSSPPPPQAESGIDALTAKGIEKTTARSRRLIVNFMKRSPL
jgi:hypothetical protein